MATPSNLCHSRKLLLHHTSIKHDSHSFGPSFGCFMVATCATFAFSCAPMFAREEIRLVLLACIATVGAASARHLRTTKHVSTNTENCPVTRYTLTLHALDRQLETGEGLSGIIFYIQYMPKIQMFVEHGVFSREKTAVLHPNCAMVYWPI